MAITPEELQAGDIIRYEDMANPPRTYIIVPRLPHIHPSQIRMRRVDDGSLAISHSDCRQHGWTLVEVN